MYTLIAPNVEFTSDVHYVYVLTNPFTNAPFYVGKGNGARWRNHFTEAKGNHKAISNLHKRNTIRKIVNEGGAVVVEIVFVSTEHETCLSKERELIEQYGRRDIGTGCLTNLTDGGEGMCGYTYSTDQREKRRVRMLGANNHMYGKCKPAEELERKRATRNRRVELGLIKPTKHTEEHKQQLRENNPGGQARAIPVLQIGTDGVVVKQWESSRDAAVDGGFGQLPNIRMATSVYKGRTVGGFYWREVGSPDVVDGKLVGIDTLNEKRTNPNTHNKYVIIRRDPDGTETSWGSQLEAAAGVGLSNSGISLACKTGKIFGGFYWEKRLRSVGT